jgi:hypothetical protein
MLRPYFLLLILALSQTAYASEFADFQSAKAFTDKAMQMIGSGDTAGGIDEISKSHTVVSKDDLNELRAKSIKHANMLEEIVGKTIGHEYIGVTSFGESFMKLTYLQKREKHAVVWNFYFYKPKEKWILNTFNYSDRVAEEF